MHPNEYQQDGRRRHRKPLVRTLRGGCYRRGVDKEHNDEAFEVSPRILGRFSIVGRNVTRDNGPHALSVSLAGKEIGENVEPPKENFSTEKKQQKQSCPKKTKAQEEKEVVVLETLQQGSTTDSLSFHGSRFAATGKDTNKKYSPNAKMEKADQPVALSPASLPLATTTAPSLSPMLTTLLMVHLGLASLPAVNPAPPAGVYPPNVERQNVSTKPISSQQNNEIHAYAAAIMDAEWKRRTREPKRNEEQQTLLASLADNQQLFHRQRTKERKEQGDRPLSSNDNAASTNIWSEDERLHNLLKAVGGSTTTPSTKTSSNYHSVAADEELEVSNRNTNQATRDPPFFLQPVPREGDVGAMDVSVCAGPKDSTSTALAIEKKKRTATGSRNARETTARRSRNDSSSDRIVYELSKHDFLVGKGGHVRQHPGNRRVRDLILQLLPVYRRATSSREKGKVVDRVIKNTHAHGGRFLEKKRAEEDRNSTLSERGASASRKRSYGEAFAFVATDGKKSQAIGWKTVATSDYRQRLSQRFREEMSGRPQTWRKPPGENHPSCMPETGLYLR